MGKADPQHIWWYCKLLKPFLLEINGEITRHLKIPLNFNLETCILHLRLDNKHQILLSNLLLAAKTLIAACWKFDKVPMIFEMPTCPPDE